MSATKTSSWPAITSITLGGLGFFDAVFLTVKEMQGSIPPCFGVSGCEQVLTSSYASILGVPVALVGAVYYLAIVILAVLYLDTGSESFGLAMFGVVSAGLIASLMFAGLQLFVLKAVCVYCLISAIITLALFLTGIFAIRNMRSQMT